MNIISNNYVGFLKNGNKYSLKINNQRDQVSIVIRSFDVGNNKWQETNRISQKIENNYVDTLRSVLAKTEEVLNKNLMKASLKIVA